MYLSWDTLTNLQNFFQLDFLFSGLEVSSLAVFVARLLVLLLFGAGVLWGLLKIVLKSLDCVQTFLGSMNRLPRTFFLLILLALPLSDGSIGARWTGYILMVVGFVTVAVVGAFMVVLWKYGLEQALRLLGTIRPGPGVEQTLEPRPPTQDVHEASDSAAPDPAVGRTSPFWSSP